MNAPIVVFGYNRIEKLKACLEAVSKSAEGLDKELFLFVDGPKGEKDTDSVSCVQAYAKQYSNDCFRDIHVTCRDINAGLATSIIEGVSEVINKYGAVIVVEDDLLVSPTFVSFCDDALAKYEHDSRIWSVGGWIPAQMEHVATEDAFLSLRAECWGWATWKDRWNLVDWNIQEYWTSFRTKITARRSFNKAGNDMSHMLDEYFEGVNHSWAIRWAYAQWKNRAYTVCPKASLVQNEGFDGNGTNCHAAKLEQAISLDSLKAPVHPAVDKHLIRRYYRAVGVHGVRRMVRGIKWGIHILSYNRKHRR